MALDLFATKPVGAGDEAHADPISGEVTLKRVLGARQLVLLGIGVVIGAGIFVLTGQAAAEHAGPAIMLSFVFAAFACALAGLCYAEFASMIPLSGAAYSYSYATLGEFVAWFIGWNLVLEYLFAAATVAVGWSGYFSELLRLLSGWTGRTLTLPAGLADAPFAFVGGHITTTGAGINLPAILIVAVLAALCYRGVRQSALANSVIVAVKLVVILIFLAFAFSYIDTANWLPFVPEPEGPGRFGWDGVMRGATIVFFSFLGFDAVATAAGEAKNPQRDMPVGILGSLAICTALYIAVAATLTGMVDFRILGTPEPVATALAAYPSLDWLRTLVVFGALAGLSSVILVLLMAQPRVFYSMARDGLIPPAFARLHRRFRTPHIGTFVVAAVAATLAGLFPVGVLGELVAMGTLLAFATVCIGVLFLRHTRPDLPRPFRVPWAWLICPLGALTCLYLFWQAFAEHWRLMLGWTVLGLLIYGFYGYRHSKLRS